MKKIIFFIIVLAVVASFNNVVLSKKMIPDEAIRLRILANSNSTYDQTIKTKVKDKLQANMYDLLKNTTEIEEARETLKTNLHYLDNTVNDVLTNENYNLGYTVTYGKNYFPEKEYKGVKYDAGYYESVLVTLGKGEGDNWWCVLFPPLCLLEAEDSTDVEYKFFVQEIIEKFI